MAVNVLQKRADEARQQQAAAERAQRRALSQRVAADAEKSVDTLPQAGLAKAVYAVKVFTDANDPDVPAAEQALWRALAGTGGFPLTGHTTTIDDLTASADGHWLASASYAEVALWDMTHGIPSKPTFLSGPPAERGVIEKVAFSPDGKWLIVQRRDDPARLWRLPANGSPVQSFALEGADTVGFSPDGRYAITVGDRGAAAWRLDGGSPLEKPIRFGTDPKGRLERASAHAKPGDNIYSLLLAAAEWPAVSDDFRRLTLGRFGKSPTLFDLTAPDPQRSTIVVPGFPSQAKWLTASPDGQWIAALEDHSGQLEAEVYVAKLVPLSPPRRFVLTAHKGQITALRFSSDSRWLVTASEDQTALLWDLTAPKPFVKPIVLGDHAGSVTEVVFSPDARWLATGSVDQKKLGGHGLGNQLLQLWDLRPPKPSYERLGNDPKQLSVTGHVNGLFFSPDSQWLVALTTADNETTTAQIWHMNPGRVPYDGGMFSSYPFDSAVLRGHEGRVDTVAFTPDSRWLVTGGDDHVVRLWQLSGEGNWIASPRTWRAEGVLEESVRLTRDNRWLVAMRSNMESNQVVLWDLTNIGAAPAVIDESSRNEPSAFALSPDDHWVVCRNAHGVRLVRLDKRDGAAQPIALSSAGVRALEISADSRWLVIGGADRRVRLWSLKARDPATPILLARYDAELRSLAVSSDGKRLATADAASPDVRLWLLDSPAAPPIVLQGRGKPVTSVAFSGDGRRLAAAAEDGVVRLWSLSADHPGGEATTLGERADGPSTLQFTADGRRLIASPEWSQREDSRSRKMKVWDLTVPDQPVRIRVAQHASRHGAQLSPDGRWLLTEIEPVYQNSKEIPVLQANLELWDLDALGPSPRPAARLASEAKFAAFSSDGRKLLIGLQLWDLTADRPGSSRVDLPTVREGRGAGPVSISHDNRFAIISLGDYLTVYPLDMHELLSIANRAAVRNLTPEEWRELFPLEPYRKVFAGLP